MDILIKDYHDSHMRELRQVAAIERLARTLPGRDRTRVHRFHLHRTTPSQRRGTLLHRRGHPTPM